MTSGEQELREALRARADAVPVGRADEAALGRRLVAGRRRRAQRVVAGAAVGLAMALGATSLAATGDGPGDNVVAGPDTSSTTIAGPPASTVETTVVPTTLAPSPPTSATPASTGSTLPRTTSTAAPSTTREDVDTSSAVWPAASGPVYTTPVAAARGFAVDFVGFRSPVVGPARQGDSRSSEVDVRPRAGGPVTTVVLRQLGSGGRWFVLASVTQNIVVAEPSALAKVTSPVRVQGRSTAYEATVNVEVRQDGTRPAIGEGFVMGGAYELAPFDGTIAFRRPTAAAGAVLLLTYSAEDGQVWEASTVRVAF